MILYRLTRCIYADDLSGTGGFLFGGRWHSEGKPVLYLTSSRSLALLEVLVRLPPLIIPEGYCLVEIEVPETSIKAITLAELPGNWKDASPPSALKIIGNNFLKHNDYLLLKVPSAIVPAEYNYLLNPRHPAIKAVKVAGSEAFRFDKRLI